MTPEELAALVDAEVDTKIAAFKAAEPVQPVTPVAEPPAVAAPAVAYTQAQLDEAVKAAAVQAAKATGEKMENAFKAMQRPPMAVPAVIHSEKHAKTPTPIWWAVKTALYLGAGKDGIRFHLDPTEEGELEFDGTQEAVKAFKAMATTANSATGEHFIPRIQTNLVTQALYQEVISRNLPKVNVYPMPGLICDAPEIGAFTAGWSAENSSATSAGDATTARKTLTAKNLTALGTLSNQLLMDSNPGVEQYVRDGLAGAIGEAHDSAFFYGTSSSTVPGGITKLAGVTSTAISTDDFYTAVLKAVGRMAKAKIPQKNIAVVTNPGVVVTALTARVGSTGDFLSAGGQVVNDPALFNTALNGRVSARLGLPVFTTTAVPIASSTADILVLYCPNAVIGDRQELEIAASNVAGSAFANNQTLIRAIMRVDFLLQRAAALEIITGSAA